MIHAPSYTVLIVDDVVANLSLLIEQLLSEGYQIRVAESGESALRRVQASRPDIVLIDVNMPGMDGFETCRRLKAEPEMAEVPVLFLTVASDMNDKARGFEAGGVDYITKPVDQLEVLLRVRTHLELARLRRELAEHSTTLESRVAARTQELREEVARRTRSEQQKDILLEIVRKQSEQLQGLIRQIVEDQSRERHSLSDDLSRQVDQYLEPIDQQMGQLLTLTENAESQENLHRIAGNLQAMRQVIERISASVKEQTPSEALLQSSPLLTLSEREREVLMLMVSEYGNDDIARMLYLTPSTVRTYRHRIMQKLDVQNNTALVRFAIRHGLLEI